MALGGGSFLTENKVLPGSYINFASTENTAVNLADRGVVAIPLILNWGRNGVRELTKKDFMKNCKAYFGYSYTHNSMYPFREMFKHAKKIYVYRLGSQSVKAENIYATAKYGGSCGNKISVEILNSADKSGYYAVTTYYEGMAVDIQLVRNMEELHSNAYVTFKDVEIEETPVGGLALENGKTVVNNQEYQQALDAFESYSFNSLVLPVGDDSEITDLFVEYTKRRRDEEGVKFQLVCYRASCDYEGVVSVYNDTGYYYDTDLVYWVGGLMAGLNVNQSALNLKYDGEIPFDKIICDFTQTQLEEFIEKGQLVLHKVNDEPRVLADINTMVTTTAEKGEMFKENQTVRVCDQIAGDIATLFNTYYLGIVPNDNAGRLSLWNDIVKHHQKLARLRAIEDFSEEDITVELGETKKSVVVNDCITVVNAMGKLYMTVIIQ